MWCVVPDARPASCSARARSARPVRDRSSGTVRGPRRPRSRRRASVVLTTCPPAPASTSASGAISHARREQRGADRAGVLRRPSGLSPCSRIVSARTATRPPSTALQVALGHHPHGPGGDRLGVVDHRARLAPRHQRAVGAVGPVGDPHDADGAGHGRGPRRRGTRPARAPPGSGQRRSPRRRPLARSPAASRPGCPAGRAARCATAWCRARRRTPTARRTGRSCRCGPRRRSDPSRGGRSRPRQESSGAPRSQLPARRTGGRSGPWCADRPRGIRTRRWPRSAGRGWPRRRPSSTRRSSLRGRRPVNPGHDAPHFHAAGNATGIPSSLDWDDS